MPFTSGSPRPSRTPATARWMSDSLVIMPIRAAVLARVVALPLIEARRNCAVAIIIRGVGRDVHVSDCLPRDLAEDGRGDRAAVLGADRVPHRDQDRQARARGGQVTDEG